MSSLMKSVGVLIRGQQDPGKKGWMGKWKECSIDSKTK